MAEQGVGLDIQSLTETLWRGAPSDCERAVDALAERGTLATPVLLRALREHPLAVVRRTVAFALARLMVTDTISASTLLPTLVQSLRDDSSIWARRWHGRISVRSLRSQPGPELIKIGPRAALAVAQLSAALSDVNPDVRYWAAATLAEIGPAVGPALPPLTSALRDPDGEVRTAAANALGKMGPTGSKALSTLLGPALADQEPEVRVAAALAVWQIGQRREGLPVLIEVLRLKPPPRSVLHALIAIGRVARMVLPALEKAEWTTPRHAGVGADEDWTELDDPTLDEDLEAARLALYGSNNDWSWLRTVHGALADAERPWWIEQELPELRLALRFGDDDVANRAGELLSQLAPAGAAMVIPDLVELAVRFAPRFERRPVVALDCLAQYAQVAAVSAASGGSHAQPPPALIQAAADEDGRVATEAIVMLATFGSAAIPPIARPLRREHPDANVRLAAVQALVAIIAVLGQDEDLDWANSPELAYIYALLMTACHDRTATVRQCATAALVQTGWLTVEEPDAES